MKKTFGGGFYPDPGFSNKTAADRSALDCAPVFSPLGKKITDYSGPELRSVLSERGVFLPDEHTCKIKALIVNFSETDVGLSLFSLLAKSYPDEIVSGAKIISRISGAACVVFAFPSDRKAEYDLIDDRIPETLTGMKAVFVDRKYPMNDTRCIVSAYADKEYSTDIDEKDIPYLCVSPETCLSVYSVLALGLKSGKYISVGGELISDAVLVKADKETTVGNVLSSLGITPAGDIILGGLCKGESTDGDAKIGENDGILLMNEKTENKVFSCLGCGRCDSACPMKLLPSSFVRKSIFTAKTEQIRASHCIDCKACSYVCPANIDVFGLISGIRERGGDDV